MRSTLALTLLIALAAGSARAATLAVPADFGTIQAAIDAAANGDLIVVAAGDYLEQLTVDGKTIEIVGAGAGATRVLSPAVLAVTFVTSADNKCIVGVVDGGHLTMSGVTVDGQGLGNANARFVGVGFRNAGGSLSLCAVRNVRDTPFSGAQHGVAVYGFNDDGTEREIELTDLLVVDYQKNGIALNGADVLGRLDGCIVHGAGPTTVTAQNGIQFGYGAHGSVKACLVRRNAYTGATWTASGLLLFDGGVVHVQDCTIEDNQMGAYYITTSGFVLGNTFTGGVESHGGDTTYYGLGVDDQGPGSPAVEPFGDGLPKSGWQTTDTVNVSGCTFVADGTGLGTGIGLWAQAGDSIVANVSNTEVTGWEWGLEVWDDGTATVTADVSGCDIHGNASNGLINYTSSVVSADGNWWGHSTGPFHSTLNPSGLGDVVSDNVAFSPWDPFGGPWVDLGDGLAGSHGVPLNAGDGALAGGDAFSVSLSNALENATAYVIVGAAQLGLPFKGGVLVPDFTPPGFLLPLPTDAFGAATIADTWPLGFPSGFSFYTQWWLADGAGIAGFAASNAMEATTP